MYIGKLNSSLYTISNIVTICNYKDSFIQPIINEIKCRNIRFDISRKDEIQKL